MKKDKWVYIFSLSMTLIIALFAICFRDIFENVSNFLLLIISYNFAWLYLLIMFSFVVFVFVIAFSKYGNVKLSKNDEKPEYSTFSWFAMLFCAGMGVGLVFWGVSEPLTHYITPTSGVESMSAASAEFAIKSSFMHWGVHAWACYAVIGLPMAYMQFRKEKMGLISRTLEPLYGEKNATGFLGKAVDVLASFATIAGIATSLGLGVLQINSGLEFILGIPNTIVTQVLIIATVTVIFVLSATSGIEKGVRLLSNVNIYISFVFMIGLFVIGPKVEILSNLVNGIGNYLTEFIHDSLSLNVYSDTSWVIGWKVFYWAWWIAWAPFSGAFIARISKGRTIRQFVIGVVFAPMLAAVVWFAILGTLGLHLAEKGILTQMEIAGIAANPESGIFVVLSHYPGGGVFSIIASFLLMVFFITSADSGTFVLASFSSNGAQNPSNARKVIWGITLSILAVGLLLAGGLKPLQTISIVAAFPFVFIMIAACTALVKELKKENI